jgi:hypothetical protein
MVFVLDAGSNCADYLVGGKGMSGYVSQHVAHKRLLAAVIGLAIDDACKGTKSARLLSDARSGMNFLFKHSDLYLSLLDIDPQQFRNRLLEYTHTSTNKVSLPYELTHMQKRVFRINYKKWVTMQAHGLLDNVEDEHEDEYEDEAEHE